MTCSVEALKKAMVCEETGSLWIFGYGSLIWKPGFGFKKRIVGYINGYSRRFYQGTTTHRGTPEWPGRVATVIREAEDQCWGVAYEINDPADIDQALRHLAEREMITGGYGFDKVMFYPVKKTQVYASDHFEREIMPPFYVHVYIAEAGNKQYLGAASLEVQAFQIAYSKGVCGTNLEYVSKVANFMRDEVPKGLNSDTYLMQLECLASEFMSNSSLVPSRDTLEQIPMRVEESICDEVLMKLKQQSEKVKDRSRKSVKCTCNASIQNSNKNESNLYLSKLLILPRVFISYPAVFLVDIVAYWSSRVRNYFN